MTSGFLKRLESLCADAGEITSRGENVRVFHYFCILRNFPLQGIGAGMLVMAPLFEAARKIYGNSGFFIALAGLTLHITVCGVLCFPSKLELHTQRERKRELQRKSQNGRSDLYSAFCLYLHVAIQRPVLCLCFCMFNYGLGTFMVILHLPNYAVHKGSTAAQASLLISVSGIMGMIGRIMTGIAANHEKVDDILLYAGSMGVVSLFTFLFPLFSHSFGSQAVYAAIFGLFFGCCYVLTGSVNIRLVGVQSMAAAIGLEFCFCGLGAIVGPVLAGNNFDLYKSLLGINRSQNLTCHRTNEQAHVKMVSSHRRTAKA